MIVLLDLNYTLVENNLVKFSPFSRQIEQEQYRQWLVEAVENHYVILMTARPEKYKVQTLQRIMRVTGWQPQKAYFNDFGVPPPQIKQSVLERFVFEEHGSDGGLYLAIESNPRTSEMYKKFGIDSVRADNPLCIQLLTK